MEKTRYKFCKGMFCTHDKGFIKSVREEKKILMMIHFNDNILYSEYHSLNIKDTLHQYHFDT